MGFFHIEVNLKRAVETFFSHLYVNRRNVRSHLISSLQMKMPCYVWTKVQTEYFLQVVKEKNTTILFDSKQSEFWSGMEPQLVLTVQLGLLVIP